MEYNEKLRWDGISNSKILEWLTFRISRDTKIGKKVGNIKCRNLFILRENMRIGKIASGAQYRLSEQFQNLEIVGFLIVYQIEKILNIL